MDICLNCMKTTDHKITDLMQKMIKNKKKRHKKKQQNVFMLCRQQDGIQKYTI